jgi:hypothetical protein
VRSGTKPSRRPESGNSWRTLQVVSARKPSLREGIAHFVRLLCTSPVAAVDHVGRQAQNACADYTDIGGFPPRDWVWPRPWSPLVALAGLAASGNAGRVGGPLSSGLNNHPLLTLQCKGSACGSRRLAEQAILQPPNPITCQPRLLPHCGDDRSAEWSPRV